MPVSGTTASLIHYTSETLETHCYRPCLPVYSRMFYIIWPPLRCIGEKWRAHIMKCQNSNGVNKYRDVNDILHHKGIKRVVGKSVFCMVVLSVWSAYLHFQEEYLWKPSSLSEINCFIFIPVRVKVLLFKTSAEACYVCLISRIDNLSRLFQY